MDVSKLIESIQFFNPTVALLSAFRLALAWATHSGLRVEMEYIGYWLPGLNIVWFELCKEIQL